MTTKITLITPPDIYQNDRPSVLFIDITEEEQDNISEFLGKEEQSLALNIYFYQGETNVPWLLHAISCSEFTYINVNNMYPVTSYLAGYILSKSQVFYSVKDELIADLYKHINLNRVVDVQTFLKNILNLNK